MLRRVDLDSSGRFCSKGYPMLSGPADLPLHFLSAQWSSVIVKRLLYLCSVASGKEIGTDSVLSLWV